jgi:type I restriction enzyme R subunit
MDPRRLYESPFTDLDDQGASGVFPAADVKVLIHVLDDVRRKTAAA